MQVRHNFTRRNTARYIYSGADDELSVIWSDAGLQLSTAFVVKVSAVHVLILLCNFAAMRIVVSARNEYNDDEMTPQPAAV